MASYPYDPALPAPGKWTGIDFSNPSLQPALRMMVRSIAEENRSVLPPEGIRMRTEDVSCQDGETITCYIFEPEMAQEKLPAMLYCHGGGFFLPIQPMQMDLAGYFSQKLQLRVYLPEYRTYPQYCGAYPFGDCRRVLEKMLTELCEDSGGDCASGEALKKRLPYLLYGESAGGMIAASLALEAKRMGWQKAAGQMLIYPALDNRGLRYPSMQRYREAAWPLKNNLAMWREYLQNKLEFPEEILVPMKALDLSDLPQAYIEPQEIDILRDEAIAYAKRLQEAGVNAFCNLIKGSYHGFDSHTDNAFVKEVLAERICRMQKMLK